MIASLSGTVLWADDDAAVIEAAGIGFRVSLPRRLVAGLRKGQTLTVFTHLTIGQGVEPSLVGFETAAEVEVFRLLLRVSGVGPRAALALVDGLTLDTIRTAVETGRPEMLTGVKGIGSKTAQRIVFDLREHLGGLATGMPVISSDDLDLVEALTALGYSVVEAQTAVQSLSAEDAGDFEGRLRAAIAYFGRR
ncbi:MAG: Holliday junction branch migration protein RuvA [Anaerolineae bacterium]|nr:Holliday junction branch migration protein RuvA [Anaerolineae bacterium]